MAGKEKNAMSSVQERVSVWPGKEALRFRRDSEFRELYEKTAFPGIMKREQQARQKGAAGVSERR